MDTRVSLQPYSLYFRHLKSIAPPTQLWESRMSIFPGVHYWELPVTVKKTRVIGPFKWSHRPLQVHGSHLRECDRLDRQYLVTNHINIVVLLCLRQYGLTSAKPQSSKAQARQGGHAVDRTRTRNFPCAKVLSRTCQATSQTDRKTHGPPNREAAKRGASTRQAAKRRGGEGAAVTHGPRHSEPADSLER